MEIITDKSPEGSQFCKGFGGIGALLRYKVDTVNYDANFDDQDEYEEYEDGLY